MERAMRKIEDFYFGDEEGTGEHMFNNFAQKHAHHFKPHMRVTEEENKLEHTLAYQEFQKIFEGKLEELVQSENLSVEEFYTELRKHSKEDEDCAVFLHVILSISDYQSFVEMMSAYCEQNQ